MLCDILEEDVLKAVDDKIFEIEEMKSNPSYEGGLKKIPPSGNFEISGVTAMTQEDSMEYYSITGDDSGVLYLLDIARKL